jgi:hypothetical protein
MKKFLYFSKKTNRLNRLPHLAFLCILLVSQSSCFKMYYQTNTKQKTNASTLVQLDSARKMFIVHTPAAPFSLKNVSVNSESISGDKSMLTPGYDLYLNPGEETKNSFARKDREMVLNQVHLYVDSSFADNNHIVLPIPQIRRMDVYGLDKAAIKKDRTLSIIGISVGGVALVILVASLAYAGGY